jgi:N-acyl-D-amino-acid deacylase
MTYCVAHPDCIIASDTFYDGGGAHPRTSGTFPKALKMLRQHGYSWLDALKKVTTMPADVMRIDAGRLRPGSVADVTVFDPENFADTATYQDPFSPPTGLKLVLLGGKTALSDGELSGEPRGEPRKRVKEGEFSHV